MNGYFLLYLTIHNGKQRLNISGGYQLCCVILNTSSIVLSFHYILNIKKEISFLLLKGKIKWRILPASMQPAMACEYFSSASPNCPFLKSWFPSFLSRARGGGRAPQGASSRLPVPPAAVLSAELVWRPVWSAVPLREAWSPLGSFFSWASCVLHWSRLPLLPLRRVPCVSASPWGAPSALPADFFCAFPMSPLSAGAAALSPLTQRPGLAGGAAGEDTPTGRVSGYITLGKKGEGLHTEDFWESIPTATNSLWLGRGHWPVLKIKITWTSLRVVTGKSVCMQLRSTWQPCGSWSSHRPAWSFPVD